MTTAIIEVNNNQFSTDYIESMGNDERIEWINNVIADDTDHEYYRIFEIIDDFIEEINIQGLPADHSYITIDYTEWTGSEFIYDKCDDVYNISTRFNVKMYEGEHSGEERQDIANQIYNIASAKFGTDIKFDIAGYWNDDKDYRFDVYAIGDKCVILNNIQHFCNEVEDIKGVSFCELQWSMDGSDHGLVSYDGDEEHWSHKAPAPAKLIIPANKAEYDQAQLDHAIEQANADLAEFIELIRDFKTMHEVYNMVNDPGFNACFGSADRPDGDVLDINYKSICLTVCTCEEGIYVSNYVEAYSDGQPVWIGDLDEQGATGVKSQVGGRIYLQPTTPAEQQQPSDLGQDQDSIIEEACPLNGSDDEYCYLVNDDYYLHVMIDRDYDQWSYALYDTEYKLIDKSWTCDISLEMWKEYLNNTITPQVGDKIYAMLPHSPKLFLHQKNA